MDTGTARARLDAAVRERDRARAMLDEAEEALRDAIQRAAEAGVSQVELAELTGYHRNTIRRIVVTPRDATARQRGQRRG